jgi:DNA-binding beta-propeller fold protein YncE
MTTSKQLATGLGGAIGCDYLEGRNQLVFVEYDGKISRLDLVCPTASTLSSGTGILHGTWIFDLETGAEVDLGQMDKADIWWEQHDAVRRSMVPLGDAKIANIGVVNFNGVSAAELQGLSYSSTPIVGNDDATNHLVNGDVFAVITRSGNYAKVQVLNYGYDLTIRWRTYKLQSAYQLLGTGYTHPEDVVVTADGQHAYVTERGGDLLYVDLANADRVHATVVSSGMTAPHQIALDEARQQAYLVEYANPGRLLRIDLTTGAQTVLYSNLENAIGLVMTDNFQFAYISEQKSGGNGQLSRVELSTGQRDVLVTGMTNPFFLTWADAGEGAILTTERDPANQVSLIDLTQVPVSVSPVASVPFRPSSVAVVSADRLLVCSDSVITELNLTGLVYVATGPTILGIGHVPFDRIVNGYADTTIDPAYFFQVKDAPFGGTLSLMINHEHAYADGARYYKVFVDGVVQKRSWSDYRWSTSANRFILRTMNPIGSGYFRVRRPHELWYNHWLGYRLPTGGLPNGLRTIEVRLYSAPNAASLMSTDSLQVQIDNQRPTAVIDEIIHDGVVVGTCAIVDSGSSEFTFRIQAQDPEEHLLSWRLKALWSDNKSAVIASDSYSSHMSPTKKWAGVNGVVPTPAWDASVPGDPTSTRCAHTFYLGVWDRVINGYHYIHRSHYHKSITIMLPPLP